MSRIVGRRTFFQPRDKEPKDEDIFRRILRNHEAFSGAWSP